MNLVLNKKSLQFFSSAFLAVALAICSSTAVAQYTVSSDFTTRPSGPDQAFSMYVALSPADTEVSGFSLRIGYDSSQVVLESVSDNTGYPAAGVQYTMGTPQPLTGVDNVDTYVPVIMDTAFNLPAPGNLVHLNFRTTASYNEAQNRVWLHLDEHLADGITDGNYEELDGVTYQQSTLVPVTLSGFSIE